MLQKILLGSNPQTSLAGLALGAAMAIQEAQSKGFTHWYQYILPVGIAVLGRIAGDSANTK